jgi:hypothetical protein
MAADRPTARLAAALLAAWTGSALATVVPAQPPTVAKPASRTLATKSAATHAWHDGAVSRPLRLDSTLEADFSPRAGTSARVLRPAGAAPKSAAPLVSPVFRDDAGRLRALPGGVLLVLREPLSEPAARALIARLGATPVRALSPTLWVVESPVGLGSLDLANRLHASGAFAAAQPNWWVERTRK